MINITSKLNKFMRIYILRTSEFSEMPNALNEIHIKSVYDISFDQEQDAIRELFLN